MNMDLSLYLDFFFGELPSNGSIGLLTLVLLMWETEDVGLG